MGRHAYLILAHKNWGQLEKLVSLLDDARNDLFIHIDARQPFDQRNEACLVARARNSAVNLIERKAIAWGDSSIVEAEVRLLAAAVPGRYDYYHLISGMDLPLKTQDEIHAFFDAHKGREFVSILDEAWTKKTRARVGCYWPFQAMVGKARKWHPLYGLQKVLVKVQEAIGVDRTRSYAAGTGSQWFSITHPFAHYLCENEALIARRFRYTFCGDEWFVQTMLLNSPFADAIYCRGPSDASAAMRCIDWRRGEPYTFRSGDFDELMASGCLFARKFDETVDGEIIDRICEAIRSGDIERP